MDTGNVFERRINYQAGAGANVVVKAGASYLHSIIVGEDVNGGMIEVSDHASDGDGNVKIFLKDPAVGTYLVESYFPTGITADITGAQLKTSFVYS